MTIPVTHYGLHTTDTDIVYLHQGRSSNNFIGLKQPSPFTVQLPKSKPCPHLINNASQIPDAVHWRQFTLLLTDPLVQALLPIPRGKSDLIPYLNDPQNELAMDLVILSRMSSPIYPVVHPLSKMTMGKLRDELSLTNVCPLILTGVQPSDTSFLYDIASEARMLPRRLLLTGDPSVPIRKPLQRIQTEIWDFDDLKLAGLPMESLGALLLRRFARGEKLDADIVKGNA